MKFLIIGIKGMLGAELQQVFKGEDTIGVDREKLDIIDREKVAELVKQIKPHIIINAAAFTDVDGAESNREAAFKVNEEGVRNLAEAAKEIAAKLVHYSTDYVFPGDKREGYGEDDKAGPAVNAYGESKLAGEKALVDSGAEYWLIRTAWLYGEGGKNFVDTIRGLAEEKDELKVVDDQFGSPTYAVDLAKATKQLIEGEYSPGIYHLTNEGVASWFEFAQEILRLAGAESNVRPVKSSEFLRPAKRPKYSRLINTKGPKLRVWREALKEYVKKSK